MKKLIKYFSIIVICLSLAFGFIQITKADSGFDTSYSSGGGSSSSSSSSSSLSFLEIKISIIIFIIMILDDLRKKKISKLSITKEDYAKLIKDISMEEMKQKVFEIYEKIQYAWSNFDYAELRKYTTDELYNMYIAQLDTLRIKSQQNIMKDIILENSEIISVEVINNITTVKAYLIVNCYDYIIDTKNKKIVRGTDKQKLQLKYEIILVKDNSSKTKINCPNCGNEVDIISSQKCQYCDSVLVQNASDFVMSEKTMISQDVL